MESKVRLVTKFRQMLAGLMVGILVMSQACSGITPVYANEKHNTALFLISGENLKNAYSEALESETFDYTSLNLGAKTGVDEQYEELLGGDAVYRLDKNILKIDDSSAPQGTAMDVFVNTDRESFIFLYENQSDITVTFRADVDGYQTESVTVKPNTENLEEEEADSGVNYNNESVTQTSEDNKVRSVATNSDASKEKEEDLIAVSAATDSDASKREEDNTVSVATGSDASEWQEDVKDSDEQMLENDTELLGKLSGTEYDTVTIGENINAKALEIPMSELNFLFSRSRRGARARAAAYSSSANKIYLQPGDHTHTDGYTAATLEEAYNLAVDKGITEIYICSAVDITAADDTYINDSSITFMRCADNTDDYLMRITSGSVEMRNTQIDGQEIRSTCSLIYVQGPAELTITGNTLIQNGYTEADSDTNSNGGAILVYGGTLYMTGGTLTGNMVFDDEAEINKDNYRNGCGGAIYIYSNSDEKNALAEFDGGTLSYNGAGKYGGAICAQYATVNFGINGGTTTVTENTAYLSGSAVCYGTETTGEIYRGKFTNNETLFEKTDIVGGAIAIVKGASVKMKNVYVSGNTTAYNYTKQCALYSCPTSHLAIFQKEGATIIDNGTTDANVGDIYYDGASEAYISGYDMLGTKIDYYNYSSNKWTSTSLTKREQNGYQYTDNNFGMYWRKTSGLSDYKSQAEAAADVIITGNYGFGPGCAISNNGTLIIGTPAKALQVKKEWKDAEGDILAEHPSEVTVYLADKDGNKLDSSSSDVSDVEVTLNADNNWSYVWSDLDSVDDITVWEKAIDGYTTEITQPSLESGFAEWFPENNFYAATIVNRPTTESEASRTKTLHVTKEWQDSAGNTIEAPAAVESVTVHLLEDGAYVDTNSGIDTDKTLNSDNNWSAAWTGLNHGKSWTIEEESVAGYTTSYTYGDNYLSTVDGSEVVSCEIKIVNKQNPSEGTPAKILEAEKEWLDHNGHPLSEHPDQVTVHLLANGSEVSTDTREDAVVVLNEDNNWDYIWKNLDDDTTWSVMEEAVDEYTTEITHPVRLEDEALASDSYYVITIINRKNVETPEPASEETTAAPDPSEEETTTASETSAAEPETTAPETSATEPETTVPETSAAEPESTTPETSATEPETTAPETTRSSSGGGPSPKESMEPRETTKSDDTPTEAPTESATEPVTESATVPETLPETQPSVSESVPEVTQPEKPIYPELPEIPVTPDGEPDIPEGTEVEIYDLDDTSDPIYTGPYEEESLNLPPGDYEIVVIDEEGVPLAAGLFTINEDGIPQSMGLPKTGDTSIPFVLLELLLAGSAAGMAVLMTRIRHMDE